MKKFSKSNPSHLTTPTESFKPERHPDSTRLRNFMDDIRCPAPNEVRHGRPPGERCSKVRPVSLIRSVVECLGGEMC